MTATEAIKKSLLNTHNVDKEIDSILDLINQVCNTGKRELLIHEDYDKKNYEIMRNQFVRDKLIEGGYKVEDYFCMGDEGEYCSPDQFGYIIKW
jgi:hypothetical protein